MQKQQKKPRPKKVDALVKKLLLADIKTIRLMPDKYLEDDSEPILLISYKQFTKLMGRL